MPCYDPSPGDRDVRAANVLRILDHAYAVGLLKSRISYADVGDAQEESRHGTRHALGALREEDERAWIGAGDVKLKRGGDVLDFLTNLLCALTSELTEGQLNMYVYDGRLKKARQWADWWEQHQKDDKHH